MITICYTKFDFHGFHIIQSQQVVIHLGLGTPNTSLYATALKF